MLSGKILHLCDDFSTVLSNKLGEVIQRELLDPLLIITTTSQYQLLEVSNSSVMFICICILLSSYCVCVVVRL